MRVLGDGLGARLGLLLLIAAPAFAQQQQQPNDGQLRLMHEPFSYVDVVDAFDDDDPFDLNLSVGYLRTWTSGNVQRENYCTPGSAGCPYADPNRLAHNWQDIAHSEQSQNILQIALDVGIFRDLALYGRLPIVLA